MGKELEQDKDFSRAAGVLLGAVGLALLSFSVCGADFLVSVPGCQDGRMERQICFCFYLMPFRI